MWNAFDALLVLAGLLEVMLPKDSSGGLANPSFIRIVGILKVVNRVGKLSCLLHFVTELRMMVKTILHSVLGLFSATVVLSAILVWFSIIYVKQMTTFLIENRDVLSTNDLGNIRTQFGSEQKGCTFAFEVYNRGL